MTTEKIIDKRFDEHLRIVDLVRGSLSGEINAVGRLLAHSLVDGGTIFWCGNGGSAADCQHLAAELVGRFRKNRRPLRSVALTTDTSVLTCVANDYSYDSVFSRQIEAMGRPGDVLIGISTSGESGNMIHAFDAAKIMGITTIALLGKGGGGCKDLADHVLVVPSQNTARIQEVHILIGHVLCELIEKEMGFA